MHPLLQKLQIEFLNSNDLSSTKDLIYNRIIELGLNAKKHGDLIIVKYDKDHKFSKEEYIRCSRGIIIDTNTKKIINASFEGGLDFDEFKNKVNYKDVVIEKAIDGTMLNLYYYNDKWNISTKFSTNAFESKFRSNKTFGQLLSEVVDIDTLKLDNKFSYSLLLQHIDNRIVSPITENKVFHLESVNIITGEKVFQEIGLPTIDVLYFNGYKDNQINFKSYDELVSYVNNLDWTIPGIMLYSSDRKWRCKLNNPNYDNVAKLLNNQINISYFALDTFINPNKFETWNELIKFYPEYEPKYSDISNKYNEYLDKLLDYYIRCKVKPEREYIDLPKQFKKSLLEVHNKYKSERSIGNHGYKINRNEIDLILRKFDLPLLYSIITK